MATQAQIWNVSTLAALSWTWTNLVHMDRDEAAEAVLRTFQGQFNAQMPMLQSLSSDPALGAPAFPLNRLTVDGRYGLNTAKAIVTVSNYALGQARWPWMGAFPARFDRQTLGMIWLAIRETLPVGTDRLDANIMWAMIRAMIGAGADAGQIAINTAAQMRISDTRTSYGIQDVSPINAVTQAIKGSTSADQAILNSSPSILTGGDAMCTGDCEFEPITAQANVQRQTSDYGIWIAAGAFAVVGGLVFAAARRRR